MSDQPTGARTAQTAQDLFQSAQVAALRLGLHPWRMVVERYAGARPAKLKRAIASASEEERYRWMRGVVGLEHGERDGMEVEDFGGRRIRLNERLVDHIRGEATRAPFLVWMPDSLRSPLEVWRRYLMGERGLEPRLYYLYGTVEPTLHSVVAIVSEADLVAFNLIPFEAKDAKKFRLGELAYVGYDQPFGRCPHGCCERKELA